VRLHSILLTLILALAPLCTARADQTTAAPQSADPKAAEPGTDDPKSGDPKTDAPGQEQEVDPDLSIDPVEPDFTLISLQTNLRLPRHKSAFRVTHRFSRPINRWRQFAGGPNLLEDLLGLDGGNVPALEYRFGLLSGTQIGIHRSKLDKVIELFAQHNFVKQGDTRPVSVDALVAIEGKDNLQEDHSPAIGVIVSRRVGDRLALYLQPLAVFNTHRIGGDAGDDVVMVGAGFRARLLRTMYLTAEASPRVSGVDGVNRGVSHGAVALEWRVGGHMFQLNFSNSFSTTPGQLARGGPNGDDWFVGFNITRKFF
jgi:hypothetical protein